MHTLDKIKARRQLITEQRMDALRERFGITRADAEEQERDELGRFGSGGGSSKRERLTKESYGAKRKELEEKLMPLIGEHREQTKNTSTGENPARTRELSTQMSALREEVKSLDRNWDDDFALSDIKDDGPVTKKEDQLVDRQISRAAERSGNEEHDSAHSALETAKEMNDKLVDRAEKSEKSKLASRLRERGDKITALMSKAAKDRDFLASLRKR